MSICMPLVSFYSRHVTWRLATSCRVGFVTPHFRPAVGGLYPVYTPYRFPTDCGAQPGWASVGSRAAVGSGESGRESVGSGRKRYGFFPPAGNNELQPKYKSLDHSITKTQQMRIIVLNFVS